MRWLLVTILALAHGVAAATTGAQVCNNYVCVTGVRDSTAKTDTYTLAPPSGKQIAQKSFGWIAIGFGKQMANTPMVICWPNSDGTFTLSQRQASNEVMPTVANNPARRATLNSAQSFSNTSSTSITFSVPLDTTVTTGNASLIWAYAPTNPSSTSSTATLQKHAASGVMLLDLLAPFTASNSTISGSPAPSASGDGSSSTSSTSTSNGASHKVLVAHVVCGALATMLLLPVGILVPRYARGLSLSRWWFPVHGAGQLIALGLIIAAYAIAKANFPGGLDSNHRKLGFATFLLAIFQVLLGIAVHFVRWTPVHFWRTKAGRGPTNFAHFALGIVIVALGFATVWYAIDEEWGRWNVSSPNVGWKVGWGLVVAITAAAYIFGLIYFLPRQRRLEAQQREIHSGTTAPAKNLYASDQGSAQTDGTSYVPPPPPSHPATQGRRLPPPLPGNRPAGGGYEMRTR